MNNTVYKINDINLEKIWGQKIIDNKTIGEIIKFEINEERSNIVTDIKGNNYSLYDLYNSNKKDIIFGKRYHNVNKFPYLIKFIFSSQKLSVQDHPKEKKETWLFLKDNCKILIGLKEKINKDKINVDYLLKNVNVINMPKYSFAVVEPGTIHSIYEDNAVCEIQNNYDVTYRYYDWDNNRKLTQEEFIDSATFDKFDVEKNTWREFSSYNSANFDMQKYSIKGEIGFSKVDYCQIIIVLEGTGLLKVGDESIEINSEESLLIIPNIDYSISGDLNILVIS
jgi:mannose-6-phosphate isomerase